MSSPKSWLQHPSQFGYSSKPDWIPATHANGPEIAAAKNQHRFSLAVRDQKHTHSITDKDIAADLKLSANHIGRYLRGETTIPTLVMHRIAQRVGLDLTISLTPREEA